MDLKNIEHAVYTSSFFLADLTEPCWKNQTVLLALAPQHQTLSVKCDRMPGINFSLLGSCQPINISIIFYFFDSL